MNLAAPTRRSFFLRGLRSHAFSRLRLPVASWITRLPSPPEGAQIRQDSRLSFLGLRPKSLLWHFLRKFTAPFPGSELETVKLTGLFMQLRQGPKFSGLPIAGLLVRIEPLVTAGAPAGIDQKPYRLVDFLFNSSAPSAFKLRHQHWDG